MKSRPELPRDRFWEPFWLTFGTTWADLGDFGRKRGSKAHAKKRRETKIMREKKKNIGKMIKFKNRAPYK